MMYVPPVVIDEIDDLRREDGDIIFGSEAFRKLVSYARVGREVNRLKRLDWSKYKPLPPIDQYPSRNRKRNQEWL